MSYELEKRYLKKDGKVNEKALYKDAIELPAPIKTIDDFAKPFGTKGVYLGEIHNQKFSLNVAGAFKHLLDNTYFDDRNYISSAIYPLLHDPLIIVKKENGFNFYKPFKEGEQTVHLMSLHINNDGVAEMKTFYEVNTLAKVREIIKTPERNIVYSQYKGYSSHSLNENAGNHATASGITIGDPNINQIIPKNNNFVKFDVEYATGNFYTDLEAMEIFYEINSLKKVEEIIKTPERNIIYSQYLDTLRPHSNEYAGDLANASGKTNEDPNINQIIPKNNNKSY